MILFFEGKDYKRSLLDSVFGNDHAKAISRGNLKDERAVLDCVGYFYNPQHSHVFILPKVFITSGQGFGCLDIYDYKPINVDATVSKTLKENGWSPDIIEELPLYLYQAIEKYRKRETDNISTEKDSVQNVMSSKQGKTELSLMDIILSLRDFYRENQDLFILIYKQAHSGFNKVNWARTIRTQQPVIKNNKVIYPYVVNRRKHINYDEELLVMYFNSLKYINNEHHFKFDIDQPYNLIPEREFKNKLKNGAIRKRLLTIKNNYFNEKLVHLWELLYLFAAKIDHINKAAEKDEYVLVRDFNNVFEDMIDVLLGDSDAPRSLIKQKDGKIVDHLFKGVSLTTESRKVYYVGDSKYYKEDAAPKGDSLFKQYTYAKNIIQTQLNWYNNSKPHLKYRDKLTEGYNITPNFFISGRVERNYDFTTAELHLLKNKTFDKNYQFKNRIFDRDTLFLRMYDINFLFTLYAYASRFQSVRSTFKEYAKEVFRKDFIEYIDSEYDFYLLQKRHDGKIQDLVNGHFKELNGKVYCPYEENNPHYGLIMMGLEKGDYLENAKTLSGLSKDFIIKEYHLGTEPYLYHEGLLFDKEVSKVIEFTDSLKDRNGIYRRESVIIGSYKSGEQKKWIQGNNAYAIQYSDGQSKAAYKHTQQLFTASFLILYDINHPEEDAECYQLSGTTEFADAKRMQDLIYPKTEWKGNETYLIYNIRNKVEGGFNVNHIIERHHSSRVGEPILVYFEEIE